MYLDGKRIAIILTTCVLAILMWGFTKVATSDPLSPFRKDSFLQIDFRRYF